MLNVLSFKQKRCSILHEYYFLNTRFVVFSPNPYKFYSLVDDTGGPSKNVSPARPSLPQMAASFLLQ